MEPQLPGDDTTRSGNSLPAGDVLARALEHASRLPNSGAVRNIVGEIIARALAAFTATVSVLDPVPDTQPGSPHEALAVLAGIEQLRAGIAALDATWQVAAEDRMREADAARDVRDRDQGRAAANEVALARRTSPSSSSMSLACARRLVAQMPTTYQQLAQGRLPERSVHAITRALDNADPVTCARIDRWIQEDPTRLDGLGTRRTGQLVREMSHALHPGDSRARAERAARKRNVTMVPLGDGMARISATLRALDAAAVMKSLTTGAEARRATGARDSFGALQADQLVAAVTGGTSATPGTRHDVGIVITDRALLGGAADAEFARIEGYGALPAHIVTDTMCGRPPGSITPANRTWNQHEHADAAATAVFRRLYTHPVSGELVAMESTARAFPVGLARMIRWRDQTCRTPWCNARIRHLDHIDPHARGGPTSFSNGQGLCARCNYLKEHGHWVVERATVTSPAAGATAITWRSPHGAQGTSPTPRSEPAPTPASKAQAPPQPVPPPPAPPAPPHAFDDPPF